MSVSDEMDAEVDRLKNTTKRLKALEGQLDKLEVEVQAPDRSVTITANMRGRITGIQLSERAVDTVSIDTLERAILTTIKAAQDAATQTTEREVRKIIPQFEPRGLL